MSPAALSDECPTCGGSLAYDPSGQDLACSHCRARHPIGVAAAPAKLAYEGWAGRDGVVEEVLTHTCAQCGATTTLAPRVTTGSCPFCARTFVAAPSPTRRLRPGAVLPMAVTKEQAADLYAGWLGGRRLAPRDLSVSAVAGAFTPVYVPSWSFDATATSDYDGQRGQHRSETYVETYTDAEGREQTREATRTVTDWYGASGTVVTRLGDVLVSGTTTLTEEEQDRLRPWPLTDAELRGYDPAYLLGAVAEESGVDVDRAWAQAQGEARSAIEGDVRSDIGGDEQRIDRLSTAWSAVAFLLLLLPVWVAAYTYGGRTYRVLVNGRTGTVWGQRPYSAWKIALLVAAIVVVIAAIVGAAVLLS